MRKLSFLMLIACVCVVRADKADPEPEGKPTKARELAVKGPAFEGFPRGFEPTKITTAEELTKALNDKDAEAAIKKEADFKKEYVLMFRWAGSGGDKLTFAEEKGKVTFTRTRGLTRDLRQHQKFFALPKKATYEVAK